MRQTESDAPTRTQSTERGAGAPRSCSRRRKCDKKKAPETRARRARATSSSAESLGNRDGEDPPLIDSLVDLAESRLTDELIHLCLRSAAHDPRFTFAMACQRPPNQLQLRMPRLPGVEQ